MWEYIVTAIGGVTAGLVGGVCLEKVLNNMKKNRILKYEELLVQQFGEAIFTSQFTFEEVKEWLWARKEKIQSGSVGVVFKIQKKFCEEFGIKIEVDQDLGNYLLLGIRKNDSFEETLLVKYFSLDQELIQNLKEEGCMTVKC